MGKLCWSAEVIKKEQSNWKAESFPAESVRMKGLALRLVIRQTRTEIGKGYFQDKAFQV